MAIERNTKGRTGKVRVEYVIGEYGEFIRTPEPRIAQRTGPGQWEVYEWGQDGRSLEHTSRMASHRDIV